MNQNDQTPRLVEWHSILEAVSNRFIPENEWPSAAGGGALVYMERRANEDPSTWNKLIEPGLRALESEASARYGHAFSELSEEQQDGLLQDVQHDRVRDWPVSSAMFFNALLELVVEGYYGNPESGGNRGGKSWEMIGFRPG